MANCTGLIKPKQIFKIIGCHVRVNGFTTSVDTSDTVTTVLGTALATAGVSGTSVPLVVSPNDTTPGVITTGVNNRVEIWDATTKVKLIDGGGNEVYGRLTESGGTYTLSYYSIVAGTETAFTMDGRDIDFSFSYRFTFDKLSGDCLLQTASTNVNDDPSVSKQGVEVCEELTVTALNTMATLTYTPSAYPAFTFKVNGIAYCVGGSGPVTVVGTTVTWNPAGIYDLETDDCVCICYHTLEL